MKKVTLSLHKNTHHTIQCKKNYFFLSTSSVLIFVRTYFQEFRKIKYTRNFLLNNIHENKYTPNIHKINISQK